MPKGGLKDSRWAPHSSNRTNRRHRSRSFRQSVQSTSSHTPPPNSRSDSLLLQSNDQPSPEREFSRFLQIVERLNWKLPFLKQGYSRAKDNVGKTQSQIDACEIQFKLDFHEFYMLIERALVRLMGIFGIVVKGDGIYINGTARLNNSLGDMMDEDIDERPTQYLPNHYYHANVLSALQDPLNPLNSIFGEHKVRTQLMRAKDLRNRWKNIDEADNVKIKPPPLETYNLELIVQTILEAIEKAHNLAATSIRQNGGEPPTLADANPGKDDWEFMVEAMDWEAV
ncbi:hypothetical protein F4804DRAFT_322785 [Jackrogersella minutella]|nr:hypothetical protein F4804DRAFT_322785 [Jackrogersella minutella]